MQLKIPKAPCWCAHHTYQIQVGIDKAVASSIDQLRIRFSQVTTPTFTIIHLVEYSIALSLPSHHNVATSDEIWQEWLSQSD